MYNTFNKEKGITMGFLNSFFKDAISTIPEDYSKIYFRWEIDGKEYGPLFFDDMITREWSGPPIEGRFENENKWRNYSYFLNILYNLKASKKQIERIEKLEIPIDKSSLKFKEALELILNKEELNRQQRAIKKQEKENQPATKNILNKLKEFGIEYADNITNKEAKDLIVIHQEKSTIKQIVDNFLKRGKDISNKFDIETSLKDTSDKMSFVDLLEDLDDQCEELAKLNINISLPEKLNAVTISKINNKIENAFFDAEDAEEQIKDREFSTLEADFKISGPLPKNSFAKLKKDIIVNHLKGNWDFERDILDLLKKHFQDITLKKDAY